jgi:hypothetical protein
MNRTDPIHFMVDIETLDTACTAVILSIGACVITNHMDPADADTFYQELDPNTQEGRSRSLATIEWWASQPPELYPRGDVYIEDALNNLRAFLLEHTDKPIIWAKGTDFDCSILAHAYKSFGMETPWKYNDTRDFRTVKKLFGYSAVSKLVNELPHNAVSDAVHQARELMSYGLELR